jgi:hypothetical protein
MGAKKKKSRQPWLGADGYSFHEYQERMRQQAQPAPAAAPAPAPSGSFADVHRVLFGIPEPSVPVAPSRPGALTRPAFEKRERADPNKYFDMAALWEHIRNLRKDPAFRGGAPIVQITGPIQDPLGSALETAAYFKLDPMRVRAAMEPWRDMLDPFLMELMTALNATKPGDVPGGLRFERAGDLSFWLVYQG